MSKTKTKKDRKKDRSNWFCCVSNIPEQIEHLKDSCKSFKRWFYIEHLPDSEEGKSHIHVMVMYGGSCRISTAANLLGIPENFVQFCDSHRSYGQYLIHLNSPEKIKYSPDDVKTNYPGLYKSMLVDNANDDINSLFSDLDKLHRGKITREQFVELHFLEFQTMPFYQKIKTYEYLQKQSVRTT